MLCEIFITYCETASYSDVSTKGNTLIDFAVGKAGDMSKWSVARLSFVFGVDVAQDNFENSLMACVRYTL